MKKQSKMKTSTFALLIAATTALGTNWVMADTVQTANPDAGNAAASTKKLAGDAKEEAITGTPRPDSKFAKLKIGMQMDEVQDVMGHAPDRTNTYETGKRWIPFYFGNDVRRLEALYKDEGCLTFANGNVWGGAGGELIHIEYDQAGKCFKKS